MSEERTALIVEIPDARRLASLPGAFSEGRRLGVPPHLTLLTPFVPRDRWAPAMLPRLRDLLASTSPFAARFSRVERFPDGTQWLAPDDPVPFVGLITRIVAAFPDFPPYGGIHDGITAHVTIGEVDPLAATALGPFLASVREVVLGSYTSDAGSWREHHRIPLAHPGTRLF